MLVVLRQHVNIFVILGKSKLDTCNLTNAKNGKDDFLDPLAIFLLIRSTIQLESFLKHGFKFL